MVAVPAGYDDLLERPLYGHLATTRPDGSVQVSPMWFDWDGELLRFAHTTKRQKYRNVQRNPRVAMSISDPDNPYRYLEVRATSSAWSPIQRRASFGVSPTATAATNLPPTPRPGARLPPTPRTGWSSWFARPGSASTNTASTPMTTPNIDLGRFGVLPGTQAAVSSTSDWQSPPSRPRKSSASATARYGLLVRRPPNCRSPSRFWSPPPR